jgi:hypothetical protein
MDPDDDDSTWYEFTYDKPARERLDKVLAELMETVPELSSSRTWVKSNIGKGAGAQGGFLLSK